MLLALSFGFNQLLTLRLNSTMLAVVSSLIHFKTFILCALWLVSLNPQIGFHGIAHPSVVLLL